MARGKAITFAEDSVIRLLLEKGKPVVEIADTLGRSRAAIYKRIDRMKASGDIAQTVLDLGQGND